MKKLSILLFYITSCAAMEAPLAMPDDLVLRQRLIQQDCQELIANTDIVLKLAGKQKTAQEVVAEVNESLVVYKMKTAVFAPVAAGQRRIGHTHPEASRLFNNKFHIVGSILQDYPQAVVDLQQQNLI